MNPRASLLDFSISIISARHLGLCVLEVLRTFVSYIPVHTLCAHVFSSTIYSATWSYVYTWRAREGAESCYL